MLRIEVHKIPRFRETILLTFGIAGLVTLVACGGGEGTPLFNQPSSPTTATMSADPGASASASTTTVGEADTSTTNSAVSSTTSGTGEEPPPSRGSFDIHDGLIAGAIAEAADSPLEGLASRDSLATARLTSELIGAGFDLTGIEVIVYPPGAAPGLLVLTSDDETVLINDDGGGEDFVTALLGSPALGDAGIERLLMQHSTSDDQGPLLITMTVLFSDLAEAAATGSDVFDSFSVQAERP